jgi:peptidoglycan-associated lipoprotein
VVELTAPHRRTTSGSERTYREKVMKGRLMTAKTSAIALLLLAVTAAACGKKIPPVTPTPQPAPPATATTTPPPPPPPPQRVDDNLPVPVQPPGEDTIGSRSLEDLNRDSPLKPVFFPLDAFELDSEARGVAGGNAEVLKRYPSWMITVEGHCDERGTAEYNLALGERRAVAVRTYLVSLGVSPERIRTVSYGKEFPFDAGHDDTAWSKNRRAHFVITAK